MGVPVNNTKILLLSAVVVIFCSVVCFFMGRQSARISAMERVIEGHYKTITERMGKLENTYQGLDSKLTDLRQELTNFIQEIRTSRKETDTKFTTLHQDINDLTQEIRKSRVKE